MDQQLVTRTDCDIVLKKSVNSDQFEVVNFKLKPFEDKEREYYKADCVLEVSAKISKNITRYRFFLKKFTTKYAALNELFEEIKTSEREILFYERLLPLLENGLENYQADFVPAFFHAKLNHIMILEDMSLKYFTVAKKSNPHLLDRFHLNLALNAVAKLHAGSWAYEEKHRNAYAQDLLCQELIWTENNEVIQSGIKGLKTLLNEYKQTDLNQDIDKLTDRVFEIMKFQTKFRNVLGHGNLHARNMLFKYDKSNVAKCVLINFGFCKYFLPAYDVLTLIFNCSNKLFRQHYFTYLVKYYYDILQQELSKENLSVEQFISFDDFQQTINYLMPAIKLQTILHLQDFGAKSGFYKHLQKDETAYRMYLYQDKSFFLLELYKKDPIFKDMINEALEELIETLTVPQVSRENCYEILERQVETIYVLDSFKLVPTGDDKDLFELILEVSDGQKNETVNNYKYLVQCGTDNFFKVQNHVIE
ncbi:unnamed protein product [Ceutorhynchus assimilis]|uniref:CHK kinase-like domain-containing protein n=1 Tax=Ceutorhynchus assimilis TaxID=467358 RepID=A0A9N9MPV0_9CUCU|nr:unnamed protein product [Ceutorhynchus assimilis]